MADLREVMDLVDITMVRSEDVVSESTFRDMESIARRSRMRDGFIGEVLVVAFAGGTGSGKSSILNALASKDLVTTGIVRPTTQIAAAVYPNNLGADISPLLDSLGVETRIAHDTFDAIVVVDLPDFDSTAEAHRHVVEEVVPKVDAVVWVLDPEKYADPILHDDFLSPLVPYESQFIFAMNQVDRLGDDADDAVDTLNALLTADGFDSPSIVAISAAPREGDPDVASLNDAIEQRLDVKKAAIAKIALDLRSLASLGWDACHKVDRTDMGTTSLDALALAAASFVSLGVAAYEVHHSAMSR
ncbi:MAG: GTPase [Acidimicrobiia bacterium]